MQSEKINERDRFYLEQLRVGELSIEARVQHIPEEVRREFEQEMKESAEELFERLPAAEFTDRLDSRRFSASALDEDGRETSEKKTRRNGGNVSISSRIVPFIRNNSLSKALPIAAAAVFALVLSFAGMYPSLFQKSEIPVERIKGMEPMLNIYRAEGEQAKLLDDNTFAREYDLLQLEYNSAGYTYGMIFSIDGRGTVTLHYPVSDNVIPELNTGSVLLPYSYQLDDAPGFERFFFIVADEEFSARQVLREAERFAESRSHGKAGMLNLPMDFSQYSITILKEEK